MVSSNSEATGLKAGEWVEIRSRQEILATLDGTGAMDGLPFMPEMLAFCGRRVKVFKRADKTCDTISGTYQARRMYDTVHLEDLRCDGLAHGGCQARCLLFWKEAWLRRSAAASGGGVGEGARHVRAVSGWNENDPKLDRATRVSTEEESFRCQATELLRATVPMRSKDVRQYARDVRSGNVTFSHVVRGLVTAVFNRVQRRLGRKTYPHVQGHLTRTPSAVLNLQPGETVRVKSKEEIVSTLDERNCNRGLLFDVEMVRYCGGTFRVLARAERVIDERTGRMRELPNDCVILEGATCVGDLSTPLRFGRVEPGRGKGANGETVNAACFERCCVAAAGQERRRSASFETHATGTTRAHDRTAATRRTTTERIRAVVRARGSGAGGGAGPADRPV
jgi:hypothetical protein